MGIITSSAANNITTGGVILPAGINDASVASVTALAQVSAGDGITLISSQTASASASLSFTTGIDSTYRTYMFKFINIHPQNDSGQFQFNLSTDGGSTYAVTKTSAMFRAANYESIVAYVLGYEGGLDLAQSTAYQSMYEAIGNDNDQSGVGTLFLFNPSDTTYVKHYISNMQYIGNENFSLSTFLGGYGNTTSAINAINFKMSSGNIDAGTIHMYGIA